MLVYCMWRFHRTLHQASEQWTSRCSLKETQLQNKLFCGNFDVNHLHFWIARDFPGIAREGLEAMGLCVYSVLHCNIKVNCLKSSKKNQLIDVECSTQLKSNRWQDFSIISIWLSEHSIAILLPNRSDRLSLLSGHEDLVAKSTIKPLTLMGVFLHLTLTSMGFVSLRIDIPSHNHIKHAQSLPSSIQMVYSFSTIVVVFIQMEQKHIRSVRVNFSYRWNAEQHANTCKDVHCLCSVAFVDLINKTRTAFTPWYTRHASPNNILIKKSLMFIIEHTLTTRSDECI